MRRGLILLAFLLIPTVARADTWTLYHEELREISAQGFVVPFHAVIVSDTRDAIGLALWFAKPVQYAVLLLTEYRSEGQARFVATHEIGHLLQYVNRVSAPRAAMEQQANEFAACFGSDAAREHANRVRFVNPTMDECKAVAGALGNPGAEPRVKPPPTPEPEPEPVPDPAPPKLRGRVRPI